MRAGACGLAMPARCSGARALRCRAAIVTRRLKHKQEVSSLKSELQKLQLETKTGAKTKEMASKELDTLRWEGGRKRCGGLGVRGGALSTPATGTSTRAVRPRAVAENGALHHAVLACARGCRKKVVDLEAKLKVALQDKTTAVQVRASRLRSAPAWSRGELGALTEPACAWCVPGGRVAQDKSKLEAQVRQYEGQKQLMQKSLEKQGAIESKKRESIMIVSGRNSAPPRRAPRSLHAGTTPHRSLLYAPRSSPTFNSLCPRAEPEQEVRGAQLSGGPAQGRHGGPAEDANGPGAAAQRVPGVPPPSRTRAAPPAGRRLPPAHRPAWRVERGCPH